MRRLSRALALVLLPAVMAVGAWPALACALNGVPSLSVNGALVVKNPAIPTNSAQLAEYTLFIVPRPVAVRSIVTFSENLRELAQSLNPWDMRRPWRWQFGDGTAAYGWTVKHAYGRAGSVRVSVDCYDPGTKQWYEFDQVRIRVGK
jgi:hypothetical protein